MNAVRFPLFSEGEYSVRVADYVGEVTVKRRPNDTDSPIRGRFSPAYIIDLFHPWLPSWMKVAGSSRFLQVPVAIPRNCVDRTRVRFVYSQTVRPTGDFVTIHEICQQLHLHRFLYNSSTEFDVQNTRKTEPSTVDTIAPQRFEGSLDMPLPCLSRYIRQLGNITRHNCNNSDQIQLSSLLNETKSVPTTTTAINNYDNSTERTPNNSSDYNVEAHPSNMPADPKNSLFNIAIVFPEIQNVHQSTWNRRKHDHKFKNKYFRMIIFPPTNMSQNIKIPDN